MSEPSVESTGSVLPTSQRLRFTWPAEPLPPPDLLKEYETLVPGSAVRILELAQETRTHRYQSLRKVLELEHNLLKARQRAVRALTWMSIFMLFSSFGLLIFGIASEPLPRGSDLIITGMATAGLLIALALGIFAIRSTRSEFSIRELHKHLNDLRGECELPSMEHDRGSA